MFDFNLVDSSPLHIILLLPSMGLKKLKSFVIWISFFSKSLILNFWVSKSSLFYENKVRMGIGFLWIQIE